MLNKTFLFLSIIFLSSLTYAKEFSLEKLCSLQVKSSIESFIGHSGDYDVDLVDEVIVEGETLQEYSVTINSVGGYDCDDADCTAIISITYSIDGNICKISDPIQILD